MEINSTVQKLRDLGYSVDQNGQEITISVFENTLSCNFYDTYVMNLYVISNGRWIDYTKWIRDHHNILYGGMFILTFDDLLTVIDRTTLMGG
jgi:hypothetical protein